MFVKKFTSHIMSAPHKWKPWELEENYARVILGFVEPSQEAVECYVQYGED